MNDGHQLEIDFRTGLPTAISGDLASERVRSACSAINEGRACGLLEAARHTPSGESVSTDVWATAFTRRAASWDVPLVEISKLGLAHDSDGFLESSDLTPLPSGAEAQPYWDSENAVVYKLFDLRHDGSLGKKLVINATSEGFEVDVADATWIDTMEKLSVLNDGGGLPTEIVGLDVSGNYLIAKQPLAYPYDDFETERKIALEKMSGVIPIGGGLRQTLIVSSVGPRCWLIGDLHERNVMRDNEGVPVLIDALLGKITPLDQRRLSWLERACHDAKIYRETGVKPADLFNDVDDDEL